MRVFVTGAGAVTTFGLGAEAFFENCLAGNTNVSWIPDTYEEYTSFRSKIFSPHPQLDYRDLGFSRIDLLQHDPVTLNALLATREALNHAQLVNNSNDPQARIEALEHSEPDRCGVIYGCGSGGATSLVDNHTQHLLKRYRGQLADSDMPRLHRDAEHLRRVNPFVLPMSIANAVPASIGIKFGLSGINYVCSMACASGTAALGLAFEAIQQGQADMIVSGGAEYCSDAAGSLMMSFDIAGTLVNTDDITDIESVNRPFDQQRSGFLFSEGAAGSLILESEQHMEKRGAEPLCEIIGYSSSFDAHSMMVMEDSGEQIMRMQKRLLEGAEIEASDIDYINAHGTGTLVNDAVESRAIAEVFGDAPYINSTKSILGHSLGASGALEAIVCAKSLLQQQVHPSRNLTEPVNGLNYVRGKAIEAELEYCLSESFAFGGHNTGLLFKRI